MRSKRKGNYVILARQDTTVAPMRPAPSDCSVISAIAICPMYLHGSQATVMTAAGRLFPHQLHCHQRSPTAPNGTNDQNRSPILQCTATFVAAHCPWP